MFLPNVIHSSQRLLSPSTLVASLKLGRRFIVQQNQYLLPFRGQVIHHHNFLIDGRFLYPVWNVFERGLLSKGVVFPYTYVTQTGHDLLELESGCFTPFHVSSQEKLYKDSVHLPRDILHDSCLLLFDVDAKVAEPLIRHHLM
jgi:hypothetical protein